MCCVYMFAFVDWPKTTIQIWVFLLLLCQSNFYNLKHCLFEAVLSPYIFVSIRSSDEPGLTSLNLVSLLCIYDVN